MKFARLIWRNLWRNKRRTLLTVTSVTVSIFVISLLLTVLTSLDASTETDQTHLRLVTRHKISLTNWLPQSYWEKIRQVPHVDVVSVSNWFGGIYIDKKNFFPQFGTDEATFSEVFAELKPVAGSIEAWRGEKTAALAHDTLAKRYGWKIGDKIPIKGTIYPVNLDLTLRGTFTGSDPVLYFHWDYLQELTGRRGIVGVYWVKVDELRSIPAVAEAIDRMFADSEAETKTETEKAFQAEFVSMIGNVKALVRNISIPIAFAILMVVANTMSMSVRERTTEVAVLKALGFSNSRVLVLLLTESTLLAAFGGALGGLGFWGLTYFLYEVKDFSIPGVFFKLAGTPSTAAIGIGLAIVIGALSGWIPAYQAARLRVVDGLRRL